MSGRVSGEGGSPATNLTAPPFPSAGGDLAENRSSPALPPLSDVWEDRAELLSALEETALRYHVVHPHAYTVGSFRECDVDICAKASLLLARLRSGPRDVGGVAPEKCRERGCGLPIEYLRGIWWHVQPEDVDDPHPAKGAGR